ncbi:MAG: flagellar protein FlaG [Luminiphilus sp.]
MDNIAPSTSAPMADPNANRPARASQSRTEVREQPDVAQATIPDISAADVAAEAAEGKVKSLSTLASVTESIDDAVEVLNEALSRKHTSAQIRKDEELNRFLVTIKDKESGEIVREVPPEALLKFARNLEELKGILFDETL